MRIHSCVIPAVIPSPVVVRSAASKAIGVIGKAGLWSVALICLLSMGSLAPRVMGAGRALSAPPMVQNLRVTAVTSSSVSLAWNDVGNEEKYQVFVSSSATRSFLLGDPAWTFIRDLPANTTSFTVPALLSNHNYTFDIVAVNRDGSTPTVPLFATTGALPPPPASLPAAPSNVQPSVVLPASVRLTWQDNSNNETGFTVLVGGQAGVFAGSKVAGTVPQNTTTFTYHYDPAELIQNTQVSFTVCANSTGTERRCSSEASVTLPAPAPRPDNLRTATKPDLPVVQLNWDVGGNGPLENHGDTLGFRVSRRTGSTGNFEQLANVNLTTAYTDDLGLFPESNNYTYRVTAFNNVGNNFKDVNVTLPAKGPAPTNVTAQAAGHTIVIEWSRAPGAGLHVVQMLLSGHFENVDSTPTGQRFVHDNPPVPGNTLVTYRVCAVNGGGPTCSANVTARTPLEAPPQPTNLHGTALSPSEIRISWNDSSTDNNRTALFIVRRGQTGFDLQPIAELSATTLTFTDTGLQQNTSYEYVVSAKNSAGFSRLPAACTARTISLEPSAPINLHATAISSSVIRIDWQDTASNEAGFRVDQLTFGNFVQAGAAGINGNTFTHTGLNPNTKYIYRVCAFNNAAEACSSTEVSATTLPLAAAAPPSELNVSTTTVTSIGITWVNNASQATGNRIDLRTNGVFTAAGTMPASVQKFMLTGLLPNTTYEFRVCALIGAGEACSESKTARTNSN